MQAIKDTWNGFMARRRLDQLWFELQTKKQRNQQHLAEIKQFLSCFLQMMQAQPPIDSVFGHRDALLDLILNMLSDESLEDSLKTLDDLRSLLQALLHISKDLLQLPNFEESEEPKFVGICSVLVLCLSKEQDKTKMRQTLKLVQFLFSKVDDLKVKMAEKGSFETLLMCIGDKQNEQCQALLLDFFKLELVIAQEQDDSGERWSLLSEPGTQSQTPNLVSLLTKVKQKLLTEIPTEYSQQLHAERHSDNPFAHSKQDLSESPFAQASSNLLQEPLTSEQIDSLLTRGDSSITKFKQLEDQNSRVLQILRSGTFMKYLQTRFEQCEDDQLSVYLMVAYILNCFSSQNWAESEKTLLPSLQQRFIVANEVTPTLVKLFNELMGTVGTNGAQDLKLRNLNVFGFSLSLVEKCQHQLRNQLIWELKEVLMANQANPVIFFKESGFQWLKKMPFTESLVDLVKYILYVLSDLQNECKQYLMSVSSRLLEKPMTAEGLTQADKEDKFFSYQLLRSYFQDFTLKEASFDETLQQLFTNCVLIYCQNPLEAKMLFATCLETQLRNTENLLTPEVLSQAQLCGLNESEDLIECYLAAQLFKCKLHSNAKIDLEQILAKVPLQNQTAFLRMLFVPKNNKYASVLKKSIIEGSELFESTYEQFTEALQVGNQVEATRTFVNLSILVSGCPETKVFLDSKITRDSEQIIRDFCLQDFDSHQQRNIAQCLLEMHIDQMSEESSLIWDFVKFSNSQPLTDFVKDSTTFQPLLNAQQEPLKPQQHPQEERICLRRIDLTFLMLVSAQLSHENLVYLLKTLQKYAVSGLNRRTLIEAGFQQFLVQLVQLSAELPRQQHIQLKQVAHGLLHDLVQQSVLTVSNIQQQLMTPGLIPMLTSILSQNSAPDAYSCDQQNTAQKCKIKLNCTLQMTNLLFETTAGQKVSLVRKYLSVEQQSQDFSQRSEWTYSLSMNDHEYQLDKLIDLGIFEVEGWNEYHITVNKEADAQEDQDKLYVNGIEVFSHMNGAIAASTSVLCETAPTTSVKPAVEKTFIKFSKEVSLKQITVCKHLIGYSITSHQIEPQSDDYGTTQQVMSLKQLLSSQDTIQQVLGMIDKARGDDQILQLLRFLTSLVTKNKTKLNFDLENLIKAKMLEMHPTGIEKTLFLLMDLSLDQVDAHMRFDDERLIPNLVSAALLELPLRLLMQVPAEQGAKFIEMISQLLQSQRNIEEFYKIFGIEQILRILTLIRDNYRKQALYETTMGLLQLFVDGARMNVLNTQVLREILDFVLRVAHEDPKQMTTRIVIDCLSVIMIHLVVDESAQLLPQLLNLDIMEFFYKILQSKEVEIREYTFKVICLFLSKSQKIKESLCYETLQDLLALQEQSMNLCMVILDASINKFVNVNDVTPEDDSLVIQMMNASRSAQKIVSQINASFKMKRGIEIVNFGMIDCFLSALAKVTNDVSRHMCLKQLTSMLMESGNIDLVFLTEGHMSKLIINLFNFQLNVTTGDSMSHSVKVFYENYLFERHSQGLAQGGAGSQSVMGGYSTTEDDCLHTSGNKSESGRGNQEIQPPTRTLDAVLDLMTQIVVRNLQLPFFQSQIYNIMLTFPRNDDRLQLQVVSRVLRYFHRQPQINEKDILLNLYRIFANLEKLMFENEVVSLKVINLINLIAFKSTTDVRKLMKEQKLLELRDQLMVAQIRKTHQLRTEFLIQSLSHFSFESIASKPIFSQNCCTEYLVLILQESQKQGLSKNSQDLKQRLQTEICQFQNNLKVTGLVEGLLMAELPPDVIKKAKAKVDEHLQEQMELRENFKLERIGRRQILCDEQSHSLGQRQKKTLNVLI